METILPYQLDINNVYYFVLLLVIT